MGGIIHKKKSRNGFTLLEVIVSVFIISIVAVTLMTMFASSYTTIFIMGGKTKAVNEAQSLIEAYYTNPNTIDNTLWKQVTTTSEDSLMTTYGGFARVYKVVDEDHNGQTLQKVTVVVYYKDNTRKVEISSLSS